MSSKTILNICLKVVGVYYALNALNMLPSTISQLVLTWDAMKNVDQNDAFGMILNFKLASLLSVIIPILLFVLAMIVIFKSEKIVTFLVKKDEILNPTASDNHFTFALNISIKIFGFFSLFSSVPYLSKLLSRYWIMKDNLKLYDNTGKIELASAGITAVIYIVTGILLLLYSTPLSEKLMRNGVGRTKRTDYET